MSVEIDSPPYPTDGATVSTLYGCLIGLRDWLEKWRVISSREAPETEFAEPPVGVSSKDYIKFPIAVLYEHFTHLRNIRAYWDSIIRDYEDNWECQSRIERVAACVAGAAAVYADAFTPFEVREHRNATTMRKMMKRMKKLNAFLEDDDGEEEDEA